MSDDGEGTKLPGNRGSTPLERVVQHVIQALCVAAILGGFYILSELRSSNAVIRTELQTLKQQLADIKVASADRYTASQAQSDLSYLRERLQDHEDRVRSLEKSIMQQDR